MSQRSSETYREDAALDVGEALGALRMTVEQFGMNLDGDADQMRQYHGSLACIEAKLARAHELLQQAELAANREKQEEKA